jgi:hypothetical protein
MQHHLQHDHRRHLRPRRRRQLHRRRRPRAGRAFARAAGARSQRATRSVRAAATSERERVSLCVTLCHYCVKICIYRNDDCFVVGVEWCCCIGDRAAAARWLQRTSKSFFLAPICDAFLTTLSTFQPNLLRIIDDKPVLLKTVQNGTPKKHFSLFFFQFFFSFRSVIQR